MRQTLQCECGRTVRAAQATCPGCGAALGSGRAGLTSAPSGVLLLVAIGMDLFGAVLIVVGFLNHQRASDAATWPGVPGTVLHSDITTTSSRDSRNRQRTMYSPVVRYRYEVDGRAYESDRLGAAGTWSTSSIEEARADAARRPVGSSVTVHVNPSDPSDACLEAGSGMLGWGLMGAGGILFAVSAGLIVAWARGRQARGS